MRYHYETGGLHVLVDRAAIPLIPQIVDGGVSVIQLRDKEATEQELLTAAGHVLSVAGEVPLFINDHHTIAEAVGARGTHVGQTDDPAEKVRGLLSTDKLLGVSATTIFEAEKAVADGADLIGVHTFPSRQSKPNPSAGMPAGLDGLRAIRRVVPQRIPIIAIGGITEENAVQVMAAGADGIAVIGAVTRATNPRAATRRLASIVAG